MRIRKIAPDWCYRRPFWGDLEDMGYGCVVLDVPYSFPVTLSRGIEITDWGTHGQTHPMASNTAKTESLLREAGPCPIGRETPVRKTDRQLDGIRRTLLQSADLRADLILKLMRSGEWDVFIACFAELHRGGHTLWCNEDNSSRAGSDTPLLDVYRAVDSALERIISEVDMDSTSIVIFSVHGMMQDHNQAHLVRPVITRLNSLFVEQHLGLKPPRSAPGGIVRWLRRGVPARIQHAVGDAVGDNVRQWVVEREIIGGVDWSRTPGFALRTDVRTEIRFNLVGRESAGLLEPGSPTQQEYMKWIKEAFLGLRDQDSNTPLVDEVVQPPQLFPGPGASALPDVVVTWRRQPPATRVSAPRVGSLSIDPSPVRGGDHTDRGFAILSGNLDGTESLPPLDHTQDFADFIKHLASRCVRPH
jgi:predicted AlkP superfamily phosphohydrolase/phosphomutase